MSKQPTPWRARNTCIVAAAALATATLIPLAGAQDNNNRPDQNQATQNQTNDQQNANDATRQFHLPDGFVEKNEDADGGVKSTLAGLTQRAVTKDSYDSWFSSFLSELDKRDKARAEEFKGADQAHLNALIGQIQTEWRNKYNADFDVNNKNLVFNDQFRIVQGEVSDTAVASNNWPCSGVAGRASLASSSTEQQDLNKKSLDNGTAVAIIRFPAAQGLPDMDVSMIYKTLSGWYVDVPADRTGENIYNDLTEHLDFISSHTDEWPNDVNEGYRMVSRQVIAALYGVPSHGESPRASAQ
jgi:hypothetical protein